MFQMMTLTKCTCAPARIRLSSNLTNNALQSPASYASHSNADQWTKHVKLYNRCSGSFVQSYGKHVNARGKYDSPLGIYHFVSSYLHHIIEETHELMINMF